MFANIRQVARELIISANIPGFNKDALQRENLRQYELGRLAPHEKAFVREIGKLAARSSDWTVQKHTFSPDSGLEESIVGFKLERDGVTFGVRMTASGFALTRESGSCQSPVVITWGHVAEHMFDRLVGRAKSGAFAGNTREEVEYPRGFGGGC